MPLYPCYFPMGRFSCRGRLLLRTALRAGGRKRRQTALLSASRSCVCGVWAEVSTFWFSKFILIA